MLGKYSLLLTILFSVTLCSTENLTFLQENSDSKFPCCKITPVDVRSFAEGLVQGLVVFDIAVNHTQCFANVNDIQQDLTNIVEAVQDIKFDNVFVKVRGLLRVLDDLVVDLKEEKDFCQQFWNDVSLVLNRIKEVVSNPNYSNDLTDHTLGNVRVFRGMLENIVSLFANQNYHDAGLELGKTLKMLFIWDMK